MAFEFDSFEKYVLNLKRAGCAENEGSARPYWMDLGGGEKFGLQPKTFDKPPKICVLGQKSPKSSGSADRWVAVAGEFG